MNHLENRKRCLCCQYYGSNVCPLMANADVFKIDKCILNYDEIKSIQPNSIEEFVFYNHPIVFLQWNGKNKTLEVDNKVITLRSGFGTLYSGKLLTVTDVDNCQYFLTDEKGNKYCVEKDTWYMSVFKLST